MRTAILRAFWAVGASLLALGGALAADGPAVDKSGYSLLNPHTRECAAAADDGPADEKQYADHRRRRPFPDRNRSGEFQLHQHGWYQDAYLSDAGSRLQTRRHELGRR